MPKIESITATIQVTGQSSREKRREIEYRYWSKPENRERKRQKDKRYYERHKEDILRRTEKYQAEHPEQRKETNKRYYRNHKDSESARQKKYIKNNREKYRAHRAVQSAVLKGVLDRQPCSVCGEAKAEAHHDNYNKPLEVRWLCHKCHMLWHAQNREDV